MVEAAGTDTESDADILYEALLKLIQDPYEVHAAFAGVLYGI